MANNNNNFIGMLQNQPTDINYLNPSRFRLVLYRAPNVVYYVQSCNLPAIGASNASQSTPHLNLAIPTGKIQYSDFYLVFAVDEEMQNYREIADWIIGANKPKSFGQYKDLLTTSQGLEISTVVGLESDIALIILDSDHNPQHTIIFHNAFPVSISEIVFDAKATDASTAPITATFKYEYWEFLNPDDINQDSPTLTQADRLNG